MRELLSQMREQCVQPVFVSEHRVALGRAQHVDLVFEKRQREFIEQLVTVSVVSVSREAVKHIRKHSESKANGHAFSQQCVAQINDTVVYAR